MRIRALIIRILRQFIRDKRTMVLMIAAPILILSLMYLVFNGDAKEPLIGTVQAPQETVSGLEKAGAAISPFSSLQEAENALREGRIEAFLYWETGAPHIKLEGSDPSKSRAVILLLQSVLQYAASSQNGPQPPLPTFEYLYGSADMASFDSFGPVLIGFFVFFFVFLIAGISFLKERTGGTLERLLATPLRRWEIVVGYLAGFGLFSILQSFLIAWYCIKVLGMMMNGSFWLMLLVILLLSMAALSFGTFLSAFANSELQMIQFIPLVIVPQMFFSGLFDLDSMSPWLRWLSNLMPLKFGADAMRSIMIRGQGFEAIATDLYVLLGMSLCFAVANVAALRKHRKL